MHRITQFVLALALVVCSSSRMVFGQDGIVENPISAFDTTIDGLFTGGVNSGVVAGEWSDVTPLGFISPPSGTFADLLRTPPGEPNALTYAAVAPGIIGNEVIDGLYLMYAYGPRTITNFSPGEFIADVIFPMTVDTCGDGCIEEADIRVLFQGASSAPSAVSAGGPEAAFGMGIHTIPIDSNGNGVADSFAAGSFEVLVFADLDSNPDFERQIDLASTGIEGAIGFGPSPLSGSDNAPLHLLVELEVPLMIPTGDVTDPASPFFGGIGGPSGYSPDPKFWGASVANDLIDPPASAGILSIDPNTGVTRFDASMVVPEPATATGLMLAAVAGLSMARRRPNNQAGHSIKTTTRRVTKITQLN